MSNKKSKLIIGISSRALFNLDESHEIFGFSSMNYLYKIMQPLKSCVMCFGSLDVDKSLTLFR